MQIVRDEALVKRRKRIGQIGSFAGLGVLAAGMAASLLAPEENVTLKLYLPFITLFVGFLLSTVGIYYTNHWGRSPRPDQMIDNSLKGLGRQFKIYHYVLPPSHLLLTPGGPVVLISRMEGGVYTARGDKWSQRFTIGRVLRFMGQEGLGNPTKEAAYQVEQVRRFVSKNAPELGDVPIRAAVVFMAENVLLDVEETGVPVVRAAKLKGLVRSELLDNPLPKTTVRQLEELFDAAAAQKGSG